MTIRRIFLRKYDPRLVNFPQMGGEVYHLRDEYDQFFRYVLGGAKFLLHSPAVRANGTEGLILPCECEFHLWELRRMPFVHLLEAAGIEVVHRHQPHVPDKIKERRLATEKHEVFNCQPMSLETLKAQVKYLFGPHFGGYQSLRF